MNKCEYEITSKQFIGKRNKQQDSLFYSKTEDFTYAVLCDGMGGMDAGELASQTAVKVMKTLVETTESLTDDIPNFFLHAVDMLDESVSKQTDSENKKLRCGTTVASVIIKDEDLYWMSVGDTRLYIFREGNILQVTRDHNYLFTLNHMFESKQISPETYKRELKKGDALTSYIGMGGVEFMDICQSPFKVRKNDIFLITTDGLYRTVSDNEIKSVLSMSENLEEASSRLLKTVEEKDKANQDNTSFILIKSFGGTSK